jgi:hypothetical protein
MMRIFMLSVTELSTSLNNECCCADYINAELHAESRGIGTTNVCREIGLLLSFVYFFGWVAHQCC